MTLATRLATPSHPRRLYSPAMDSHDSAVVPHADEPADGHCPAGVVNTEAGNVAVLGA
ncbi:MAG TPA: hypothetical protein VGS19_35655 [Streptosporangiaceae bacterium]|nr:hypothetical protein [Streptosporangiaceae bacterium]